MVKEIGHYSLENPATIFDEEAMTALELAARTAGKVNECVKEVNNIPEKIAVDVQAHIDNGEFDKAIDEYAGQLEARLNNLIGNLPEGGTTMDAEIVDARVGYDEYTSSTLGNSIRRSFINTVAKKTPDTFDANECQESGFYIVGGSDPWVNLPEAAGNLISFDGAAISRRYQLFLSYNDVLYMRHMTNDVWQDWRTLPNTDVTPTLLNGGTGTLPAAIDTMTEMGIYRVSSSVLHDAPDVAGLLVVYNTGIVDQCYQLFFGYSGTLFYRVMINGFYMEWKQVAINDGSSGGLGESLPWYIKRVDMANFEIYLRGTKGYTCYHVGVHNDAEINLSALRIKKITVHDKNKTQVGIVSNVGHDVEGAVLLEGESDHIGGVHGDELMSRYAIFIGGKAYEAEEIPDGPVDSIDIMVVSNLYHADGGAQCMMRAKHLYFQPDGTLKITNSWIPTETLSVQACRTAMLSVNDGMFTHYNVYENDLPKSTFNVWANIKDNVGPTTSHNLSDNTKCLVEFMGEVRASIRSLGMEGKNQWILLHNYGDRLKVYYDIWHNASTPTAVAANEMANSVTEIDIRY